MSIEVVCPNGHVLHVKDSLAGKTGLCPTCKARISVPATPPLTAARGNPPSGGKLTEDAILDILGPHEQDPSRSYESLDDTTPAGAPAPINMEGGPAPTKTSCSRCHQVVPLGTVICPHCRTFIAALKDLGQ